uniref:3-oxoacyl-[acyl-carrier-protein] reductase n=1 Tax=Araucaria cunninghamii TaxID=56994 RepID=A0A0D6QY44_ARACU
MADEKQNAPLKGRVAIVTGASRGIGREIALHLAGKGADLLLVYASNHQKAEELASTIRDSAHVTAIPFQADISDSSQVVQLFDKAEQAFGRVHVLVNSAGVMDDKYSSLAEISEEEWDKIFNINCKGAFLCSREAAKRLVRGGGGRIINVSTSLVGALRPGYGAYTASKAAVETMTKILARELRGTKITANCVAPGPTATELFFAGKSEETVKAMAGQSPLERLGTVEDVAPLVAFLASDDGEWVNAQVVRVNGGLV